MQYENSTLVRTSQTALSTNAVLRNTYILLALTFVCSSLTAGLALITNAPPMHPLMVIVGYIGLLFLTTSLRNSAWGLASIFALTGFMGYTLGPILNYYIHHFSNGTEMVMMSLGATGLIFFGLSGYAMITRKDFSYMTGFLMVGMIVAFLASLGAMFFHLPLVMLAVSAMFVLISSGIILVQTSQIIQGGETNYIMATITLYVSLYNLFISLLNILGFLNSRD